MNVGLIIKRVRKAATDNAPALLTAVGVTGAITTAVLVGKASFKTAFVVVNEHHKLVDERLEELPMKQQMQIILPKVWTFYIPAAGSAALTIAAIVGANHLSTKRAAALASAFTISQEAFITYKDKVIEKFGESKEQSVVDAVAADKVKNNPPAEVVIVGSGKHLCLDTHSGRYFMSTLEDLKKAENDTNYEMLHSGYASLTDYWDHVGLPKTSESDEVGWSSDTKLVVEYGSAVTEDGRPCLTISFRTFPVRGYGSIY